MYAWTRSAQRSILVAPGLGGHYHPCEMVGEPVPQLFDERIIWAPWPVTGANLKLTGGAVALMIARAPRWIHRRVERVSYPGELSVRRRVSVDFHLPVNGPIDQAGLLPIQHLVPLAVLRKRLLLTLDVRDEGGSALPFLTQDQNGLVSASALITAAEGILLGVPSEETRERLATVASAWPEEAVAAMAALQADRQRDPSSEAAELLQNDKFESLVRGFAYNFLLLVAVDPVPGNRRVLKFAYDEPVRWSARTRSDLGLQSISLLARMAWAPAPFFYIVPGLAYAGSYHFEVEAPIGLEVEAAGLFARHLPVLPTAHRAITAAKAHLHVTRPPAAALWSAGVSFGPPARGLVRSSALITAFITALLFLAASSPSRLTILRGSDAAVAILLVGLGFMSAAVSRPGEHILRSRLLSGTRIVVVLAGMAAYTAAVVLVARVKGTGPWWALASIAAAMTLSTLVSLVVATFGPDPEKALIRAANRLGLQRVEFPAIGLVRGVQDGA